MAISLVLFLTRIVSPETILKAATYEFRYKPNISINIILKEDLNSSNFFLEDSQTKYLNALLDNVGKKLRTSNA